MHIFDIATGHKLTSSLTFLNQSKLTVENLKSSEQHNILKQILHELYLFQTVKRFC